MQKDSSQCKISWFLGTFLIPILFFLPVLFSTHENYTGLLSSSTFGIPVRIVYLLLLIYLYLSFYKKQKKLFLLFLILAIGAFLTPWIEENSLICSLHLLFTYSAFVVFNILMFQKYMYQRKYLLIYFGIVLFSFFLCMVSLEVTALAEAVYGSAVSILLVNAK